jgi:hypothetical protein
MEPVLKQRFLAQLTAWIEARLESRRLPFQFLELDAEVLTCCGPQRPDLTLWINRDSLLAGSVILLTDEVDDGFRAQAAALCAALGLGHFVTWERRRVAIWLANEEQRVASHLFDLPPANRVTPDDFETLLDQLLDQLKMYSVVSAPDSTVLTPHYFANLCLHCLRQMAPGLTSSSRFAAGKSASDAWVERAPLDKAWLSLWRILYLLMHDRLPPGPAPERLERAIDYALDDLHSPAAGVLALDDGEAPLSLADAVRLHQMSSRLRQLGWPHDRCQAQTLIELLLAAAAQQLSLDTPQLPWAASQAELCIDCLPQVDKRWYSQVAPLPYLAGRALLAELNRQEFKEDAEQVTQLSHAARFHGAVASFADSATLSSQQRSARMLLLRNAWPNRRFELPVRAPAWLWDALHLAGMIDDDITLILPADWSRSAGMEILWEFLGEKFQLSETGTLSDGRPALRFIDRARAGDEVIVHRGTQAITCRGATSAAPGTVRTWLEIDEELLRLLAERTVGATSTDDSEIAQQLGRGIGLFLLTRFGRWLWQLCSDNAALPRHGKVLQGVVAHGVPLPNRELLLELSHSEWQPPLTDAETALLEQDFSALFGPCPELPSITARDGVARRAPRRRKRSQTSEITARVFVDGVPRFPEHYLMAHYQNELDAYRASAPLVISDTFFDTLSLQPADGGATITVCGRATAEALVLASQGGQTELKLPRDETVTAEICTRYRADLAELWDRLVRECRLHVVRRTAALRLAKRIWQQQGLPAETFFTRSDDS